MRDHTKLKAFELADGLAVATYRVTATFPKEELFGMVSQMRRAAVSIPSNIVEGCARRTEGEFLRFLDMAYGSARELEYQASLAFRLAYIREETYGGFQRSCVEVSKVLGALIRSFRKRGE